MFPSNYLLERLSTCSVLLILEAWFFSMIGLFTKGGFSNRGLAVMWLPRLTSTKDLVQVCMQIDLSFFVGFEQAQFCVALVLGMANSKCMLV